MKIIKLSLPLVIFAIISFLAAICLKPVKSVFAQELTQTCITDTNITINASDYLGKSGGGGTPENPGNIVGASDGSLGRLWDNGGPGSPKTCYYYNLPGILSASTGDTITIEAINKSFNAYQLFLYTHPDQGEIEESACSFLPDCDPLWIERNIWDWSASFTGTVGSIALCVYSDEVFGTPEYAEADAISITLSYGQYCYTSTITSTCSTVQDYHFTNIPTETWTLDGSASIVSSSLILNNNGMAAQNLITNTVIGDLPYNAAISISNVTASTDLLIWLYNITQTLTITQPGLYTVSLIITDSPTGTVGYLLWNLSDTTINIDWTCIYTGTRDFEEVGCLSGLPTNGYFTTANYWDWYRGAVWKSTKKNGFLPYSESALIHYTPTLTLPEIYPGETLIMTYDAKGACSENGKIAALIENPELISGTSIINYHDTHQKTYTFEDDISDLANTGTWLFFANPGLGFTSTYTSTDDIYIDNVCIFIASRTISAPYQTDPDETTFLDTTCAIGSGLAGLSDCGDVDGIWASFGVNMAYYRAIYAAGASIWDPIGWVPWLISAIFVNLADWSCFFLAAYLGLMNFLAWLLNNILNIFDWVRRYLTQFLTYVNAFLEWLQSWFWFFWAVFYDFVTWLVGAVSYWISFINQSWLAFWNWVEATVLYWVNWIYEALGWLDEWVNGFWAGMLAFLRFQFYFIQEIYNFIVAAINMATTFLWWIWSNFIAVGQLPISFYWSFDSAINSTAYDAFISCSGETSFWCVFLAGVQIINQTLSQSVLYPIVIVCIILATVVILWRDIRGIFSA